MINICSKRIILFILFIVISLIVACTPLKRYTKSQQIQSRNPDLQIELFVMSQCPYAIEAEKAIIPLIKKFKERINFKLYFIAEEEHARFDEKSPQAAEEKTDENEEYQEDKCHGEFISEGGKFKSLNGKSEIDEDIRQVVIVKYYPEKFLDYLLMRSENFSSDKWEESAVKAWMDCEFISRISQSEEAEQLFKQNIKKAHELKISASPTLFVNGRRYRGQISQYGVGRILCKESSVYELCTTIPVCGNDADCVAEGKVGICVDADKPHAACRFSDPVNFKLTVIDPPKECPPCSPENLLVMMEDLFPAAEITRIESNSAEAKNLIEELNIKILPAFYFEKQVTTTARYQKIKDRLLEVKDGFLLDPQYLNISYLLGREEEKGDIKLFVESMSPKAIATENVLIEDGFMDETDIDIHYIAGKVNSKEKKSTLLTAIGNNDNPGVLNLQSKQEKIIFKSPKGMKEIQEDIRQMCIKKYYPPYHVDYLSCINKKIEEEGDVNWGQCLKGEEIDYKKIETCTNMYEGMNMLLKDIALIEELGTLPCPSYLINNTILFKGINPVSLKKIYSELIQEEQ